MRLLTIKAWKNSKSQQEGLTFDQEVKIFHKVYEFARTLETILQNCNHPTFNHYFQKALSIFHRFTHQVSLKKFNHQIYMAASLFLSAKDNDLFDYSVEVDKYAMSLLKCYSFSKELKIEDIQKSIVEKIIDAESHIMQMIGYDLNIILPQTYLIEAKSIISITQGDLNKLFDIAQKYVNDLFFTNACLYYQPKILALYSIEQAAKHLNYTLQDLQSGEPWYSLFNQNSIENVETYTEISEVAIFVTECLNIVKNY